MMRCLAILLLVVSGASGAVAWCNPEDANNVIGAWAQVSGAQSNGNKWAILEPTTRFFVLLMEKYPDTIPVLTRSYGNNVHSPEFQALFLRVANALDISINALRSPLLLDEITSHLAKQHAARPGIAVAHFTLFRDYFRDRMDRAVDGFNPVSWDSCVTPILNAITARLSS